MADRLENNPRTSSSTEAEMAKFQEATRRSDVTNVNSYGSGNTIAAVIGVIAVLIAAYFLIGYDWNTTTVAPPTTIDNSNTTVVPDATAPATPPATPPAADTAAPPADAPLVTPPVGTTPPATPPATTTP